MPEKAGHSDAYNTKRRERWAQDPAYRATDNARRRAHYQAHKQESSERARSYRQAHKEEIRERARAYYLAHKQQINEQCRAYYHAHKHASAVQKVRRLYGISPAEYDALLTEQGGACAICRRRAKGRLCVDHCHVTGTVRGLLCSECNCALGYLKDDQASLVAALAYLGALPCDGLGSAAQRALAVHDALPLWPGRRAVLTHPPVRCNAAPRARGIGGRTLAFRPTSRGEAVLPTDSIHEPSNGGDMTIAAPPTGGKSAQPMRDALGAELAHAGDDGEGHKVDVLQLVARKLAAKALEGDLGAIREIFDRIDGKSVAGSTPEQSPRQVEMQ
jgi:hypothetical protein